MARNEEKHFCRLNRLLLQQQKEEELKKNPPRPKLCTLNSAAAVKKWLPSISRDLNFCLQQSQVPCYPESKIAEFNGKIEHLKWEYKAFVKKLRELQPGCDVLPWTERAYRKSAGSRKRNISDLSSCVPAEKSVRCDADAAAAAAAAAAAQVSSSSLTRLSLPLLDGTVEDLYRVENEQESRELVWNTDARLEDLPLCFTAGNGERGAQCRSANERDSSSGVKMKELGQKSPPPPGRGDQSSSGALKALMAHYQGSDSDAESASESDSS